MAKRLTHPSSWWLSVQEDDDDAWSLIAKDLNESHEIIQKILQQEDFKILGVVLGGTPKFKNPKDNMSYAMSIAINLLEEVEANVSNKRVDLESMWIWGEFQKSISILHSTLPQLKADKGRRKSNESKDKELQRRWYSLWYDYFNLEVQQKGKKRKDFESYFEKILHEIHVGKRQLVNTMHFDNLISFIEKMTDTPDNKDSFILSANFRDKHFYRKKIDAALRLAYERYELIPPVGEDNYPHKK